jgi:hypothetical protein
MAKTVQPVLQSLLGEKAVIVDAPKLMGSEDFHHLVIENEKHQYLYMFLGTAKPEHFKKAQAEGKQVPYSNHNPDYQVDLEAIPPWCEGRRRDRAGLPGPGRARQVTRHQWWREQQSVPPKMAF